jgi:hypothetical protein
MVDWLTSIFLGGGGMVASWFVPTDAPSYSVAQGVAAMLLIVIAVAVLACWPKRGGAWLNRPERTTVTRRTEDHGDDKPAGSLPDLGGASRLQPSEGGR